MQKNIITESILKTPFSSYIIAMEDEIFYYTQSFAEQNNLNPSQSSLSISKLTKQNIQLNLIEKQSSGYKVFSCHQENSSIEAHRQTWSEDLIHELRSSSFLMELGPKLLIETSKKISVDYFYNKLRKESFRQKLCTLIASDFIQLLSLEAVMSPTSLSKIISNSWGSLPDPTRVRFNICISDRKSNQNFNPNPYFYGNELLLSNFLKTIITWFENGPITIDIKQENRISMRLSFSIPFDQHLSTLQNYRLVYHYLIYITAFYNLRCWTTQSTLNIIFPLIID